MSQVPEETYTLAEYRNVFKKRFEFTNVTVLGSDANGTHFQWDDARGERHFGVISDLVEAKIVRMGQETVVVALNSLGQTDNVTLSPALPGDVSDYLTWGNPHGTANTLQGIVSVFLTSLTNLRITVGRQFTAWTSTPPADHAGVWPSDSQIDVGGGHQHATDAFGLTDYSHTTPLISGTGAALTFVVDWFIVLAI